MITKFVVCLQRLWAEMEQKKLELASLKAELSQSVEAGEQQSAALTACQESLREKEEAEQRWQQQVSALTAGIADR